MINEEEQVDGFRASETPQMLHHIYQLLQMTTNVENIDQFREYNKFVQNLEPHVQKELKQQEISFLNVVFLT